jgi:hypothetical protein
MPGPQFLKPEPAPVARPVRHFSLDQANKTLPLVKRIVADIVRTHTEVTKLQTQMESAGTAIQDQLAKGLEHLQDYVEELTEIGCELKDYRLGLIDFIGRHDGRDVCLCWKLGEEKIFFWHEIRAGFTGRQPIATLREKA